MEKIPISMDLQSILPSRFSPVAIVDREGHIIGTYVPRLTEEDMEPEGGWPTPEQLDALINSPGRRHKMAEVIAHLRSLG